MERGGNEKRARLVEKEGESTGLRNRTRVASVGVLYFQSRCERSKEHYVCFILTARRTRDAVDCHRVVVVAVAFVAKKDIVFISRKPGTRNTVARGSDGKQMIDR